MQLLKQVQLMGNVEFSRYNIDGDGCEIRSAVSISSMGIACKNILRFRELFLFNMICLDLCLKRWHRDYLLSVLDIKQKNPKKIRMRGDNFASPRTHFFEVIIYYIC